LELHPDRNPNNHEVSAKFILVSKAYECLTDEKVKANCQKFGNPDGQ
jgi:DnaJ-class molecular chaperone